jgi:hypothetical protein
VGAGSHVPHSLSGRFVMLLLRCRCGGCCRRFLLAGRLLFSPPSEHRVCVWLGPRTLQKDTGEKSYDCTARPTSTKNPIQDLRKRVRELNAKEFAEGRWGFHKLDYCSTWLACYFKSLSFLPPIIPLSVYVMFYSLHAVSPLFFIVFLLMRLRWRPRALGPSIVQVSLMHIADNSREIKAWSWGVRKPEFALNFILEKRNSEGVNGQKPTSFCPRWPLHVTFSFASLEGPFPDAR